MDASEFEDELLEPCPIGSKTHYSHDEKIRELQAFKDKAELTPRLLAERIIKLEHAMLIMDNKLRQIEKVKHH